MKKAPPRDWEAREMVVIQHIAYLAGRLIAGAREVGDRKEAIVYEIRNALKHAVWALGTVRGRHKGAAGPWWFETVDSTRCPKAKREHVLPRARLVAFIEEHPHHFSQAELPVLKPWLRNAGLICLVSEREAARLDDRDGADIQLGNAERLRDIAEVMTDAWKRYDGIVLDPIAEPKPIGNFEIHRRMAPR